MDIYTVSFFGHSVLEWMPETEEKLEKLLCGLINQKSYIEFLIGREGDFDILAASVIKRAIRKCGYGNTHFTLVLPYMKATYRDNVKEYLAYYDDVEICAESAEAHYKSAIQVRNRCMVDRSDLVVCCIQHKSGGAYQTVRYAEKQHCRVVNLADID